MSNNVGSLAVILNLQTGAFAAGLNRATGQVQAFAGKLTAIHGAASGLATKLLTVVGIGGGIAGIAIGAQRAAERLDQMGKTADRLGVTTQSLAGLRLAADLAGVSSEELEKAMGKLQVKAYEAAAGNDEATKSLAKLGIPIKELSAAQPDQQLRMVADAVGEMGTQAEKAAAMVDIFGKEGAKLMPLFAGGADDFATAAAEAEKFGLAISRVDAAKVEEAQDAMTRVGSVLEGLFNQIAIKVAPFITALSEAFINSSTSAGGFGATVDSVVDAAVEGAAYLAEAWRGVRLVFQAGRVAVPAIAYAYATVADTGVRAAQWIGVKFQKAWDLVGTTATLLWNSLKVGWAAAKVPVAELIKFISHRFAWLLETTSEALGYIDADMATSLGNSAMRIRTATSAMATEMKRDLTTATNDLTTAGGKVGTAFSALFAPVKTEGVELITGLRTTFGELVSEEATKLGAIWDESGVGDRVREAATLAKNGAQVRAEAKAKTIAAEQAEQTEILRTTAFMTERERAEKQAMQDRKALMDALHQETIKRQAEEQASFTTMITGMAQSNLEFALARDESGVLAEQKWQEEHNRQLAALETLEQAELISRQDAAAALGTLEEAAANHRIAVAEEESARKQQLMQTLLSGTSSFLGNLATLQQSHDKRMRAVGKAAAKAKIVVDTATAAMAAYQAMAGIPIVGPFLGAAAAAAAVVAGAVQLANVDRGSIGDGGASTNIDASAAPGVGQAQATQTLLVQGDFLSPETLAKVFAEARERGITIDGVRRA